MVAAKRARLLLAHWYGGLHRSIATPERVSQLATRGELRCRVQVHPRRAPLDDDVGIMRGHAGHGLGAREGSLRHGWGRQSLRERLELGLHSR